MRNNVPVNDIEHKFPNDPSAKIISVTDTKGNILDVNDTFIQMSGFSKEELIGQPQNIVRHPDMPPEVFRSMWDTIKSGKSFMGIIKNRCKDGGYYWVNAYIMPIIQDGKIVGYESVRTAATPEQIQRATKVYKRIREGKSAFKLRINYTNFICYGLFLLSFAHAFLTPSMVSVSIAFVATLISLSLSIYQHNKFYRIIDKMFHTQSGIVNTIIYTDSSGKEGSLIYDVLYNLKEVDSILTRVRETSERLSKIADNNLNELNQSTNDANEKNRETKMVAIQMSHIADNISTMINDISSSAKATAQSSNTAADLVSDGKQVADQTMGVIENLRDSVNDISEAITDLANRVDDIEKASDLIKGIASQTNLLALNASIEAARAGEAGRGFAVVADEVRSLSLRTEETTVQIHNLIALFKKTANHTKQLSATNQENVELGVEQVHLTNQKLDAILQSINEILRLANTMAQNVETHSGTAQDVNLKVQHITNMTEETTENTAQNLNQSLELHHISTELKEMINRFSNKNHI